MANLSISFNTDSAPTGGYTVKYRQTGTSTYTTVSPNPTSSPVVITGVDESLSYEGTVQSNCTGSTSTTVPFSTNPIPVTVNWSNTLKPAPYVHAGSIAYKSGTEIFRSDAPSGSGVLSGTYAGSLMRFVMFHYLQNPWPTGIGASARMVVKKDTTTIYDTGTVTDGNTLGIGDFTTTLSAGSSYSVSVTSTTTSNAGYSTYNLGINNNTSVQNVSSVVVNDLYDSTLTPYILEVLYFQAGSQVYPFNTLTDSNTLNYKITNGSSVSMSVTVTGISSFSSTVTVAAGATVTVTGIPKGGVVATYN